MHAPIDRQVTHVELETDTGPDAFLIDYAQQAPIIEEFLEAIDVRYDNI